MSTKRFTAYLHLNTRTGGVRVTKNRGPDEPYVVQVCARVVVEVPQPQMPTLDLSLRLPECLVTDISGEGVEVLLGPTGEPARAAS